MKCLSPEGDSLNGMWFLFRFRSAAASCSSRSSFLEFDTSCFSGEYVTGEKIGDKYFERLYNLRNDAAKEMKNSFVSQSSTISQTKKAQQSNDGCESVSNDKRGGYSSDDGCESLTNNTTVKAR